VRVLGPLFATFALSCSLAWIAGLIVISKYGSVVSPRAPHGSNRSTRRRRATDGRRLAGLVQSYTAESEHDRELGFVQPHAALNPGDRLEPIPGGDFIIVRERTVALITGRYVDKVEASPRRRATGRGRRRIPLGTSARRHMRIGETATPF
jgi:hypothetical protein